MIHNPNIYKTFIRPLLFLLEPEKAQSFADYFLRRSWIWESISPMFSVNDNRLETDLCGIRLKNPIGLAAGYDKDCEMLSSFSSLGFGYVSGGTVLASPQPGNPKPRLFRLPEADAIINRMGFNNHGVDALVANVRASRYQGVSSPALGLSVDSISYLSLGPLGFSPRGPFVRPRRRTPARRSDL